jgi:hypothetical protein
MIGHDELHAHLTVNLIAGQVATSRERNLRNYARLSGRDPDVLFGLDPEGTWSPDEVLALLARRCGVSPDPAHRHGQDTIDPELTIAGLDALAALLARTAESRGAVLLGTGHPGHLLGFYAALAASLGAAGCALLTPARGRRFLMHGHEDARPAVLDYVEHVGVVRVYEETPPSGAPRSGGAGDPGSPPLPQPVHTHSPQPVRIALAALVEEGRHLPDLVIGDHGWACGAGRLGVRSVGLADSNDPAVFVAEAEGEVAVTVPLDDGVRPDCYGMLSAYVLQQAGMSQ